MALLRMTLCAAFMVTVAMSKPVYLNEGEDSSESIESNSSEEMTTYDEPSQEPLQPALTDTDMPNAKEETDPLLAASLLPSADAGPSPAMLDTSAQPDPEDPQSSTDALQLLPVDPSQTALGMEVSQDMPVSDPSQDSINAEVLPDSEGSLHPGLTETDSIMGVGCTNQPEVTNTASQIFPLGVTPHIITPTTLQFSTAPPLPIAMGTALTGIPVCFTLQLTTSEPEPPRGDSM